MFLETHYLFDVKYLSNKPREVVAYSDFRTAKGIVRHNADSDRDMIFTLTRECRHKILIWGENILPYPLFNQKKKKTVV